MTRIELDLSRVTTPRELHEVFASRLAFPDSYGHNWDAFWDLISSDCPLPDELAIRDFERVERDMPREVERLLTCLADYANSGRVCLIVRVADASASECAECESPFAESPMTGLCAECAHVLYGYPACTHEFAAGTACQKCGWNGSRTDYVRSLLTK